MLAYVFWHWRRFGVSSGDYESRLVSFHRALKDAPPEGFSWSACFAISNAPWANDGKDAYEDWYLVRDSGALDPLNDAAISASRKVPHDAAASVVADGTAGLYRLHSGEPVPKPSFAYSFGKPDGWSYARLFEAIEPIISRSDRILWKRQMAFGPAREYFLHSKEQVTLPAALGAQPIPLRAVFPGGA
jgi:hypothetical protein